MDSSILDGIVACLDMKREWTGINVDTKIFLVKGGRMITWLVGYKYVTWVP